jgi:Trk K+ transport system NAD-binding subunit
VLAIERGGEGRTVPHGDEPLQAGDVLALVGTHDAITRATALLQAGEGGRVEQDALHGEATADDA